MKEAIHARGVRKDPWRALMIMTQTLMTKKIVALIKVAN